LIKTQPCQAEASDTEMAGNGASGHPARDGASPPRVTDVPSGMGTGPPEGTGPLEVG